MYITTIYISLQFTPIGIVSIPTLLSMIVNGNFVYTIVVGIIGCIAATSLHQDRVEEDIDTYILHTACSIKKEPGLKSVLACIAVLVIALGIICFYLFNG